MLETAVPIFIKTLFLIWLWIESSQLLTKHLKLRPFWRRLLNQGTFDCAVVYGLLLYFSGPSVNIWLHSVFLPLIALDIFIERRSKRLQTYFWLELVIIFVLVQQELKIPLLSDLKGGYFSIGQGAGYVTFFWLILVVSLINLFNVVEGLLYGISMVMAASFIVGIAVQPWVNAEAIPLSVTLLAICTMFWLFTSMQERTSHNAVSLGSALALVVALVSIVSTSKTIALISLTMILGLFALPVIFFAFLIYHTHFQYKIKKAASFLEQTQILWRFSSGSVNAFIVMACVTQIFVLLVFFLSETWTWSVSLSAFAILMFARFAGIIFIKKKVKLKDIYYVHQDYIILFGTRIFRNRKQRALDIVSHKIEEEGCHHLITPDALCLLRSTHDPHFATILRKSFMAIPDGAGVLWASIFLKERPIQERIPGIDFTLDICYLAKQREYPVYFLGSRQETLDQAVEIIQSEYPGLVIAGQRNGYFSLEDESQIVDHINASGARILFVAMGVPLQEQFIDRNRRHLKVNLVMGVGGALDVISGRLKRCPQFFQDYGLEWAYRTVKQPWRLTRVLQLPVYILNVMKLKLRQGDREEAQ